MKTPIKQEKKVMSEGLKKVMDKGRAIQAKQKAKAKEEVKPKPKAKQEKDPYKGLKDAWGKPVGGPGNVPPFSQKKSTKTKK
jgi:hypothetical protein